MPSDLEQLILDRLDSMDRRLERVLEQQHENALKIRTIESRMATYAGIIALIAAGAVQAASHLFFP